MAEDKTKNEDKDIKKVDDKLAEFKVDPSTPFDSAQDKSSRQGKISDLKEVEEVKEAKKENVGGVKNLEELPEDIVKKMEKRKAEVKKLKSKKKVVRKRKKAKVNISIGKAFIKSSYNNTL